MARIKTKDDFIIKVITKHGDKYDYSKVEYVATKQKVEIICPAHGSFFQSPANHLKGQGCPECGMVARSTSQRNTLKEFIDSVKTIHRNKYDYSEVVYINSQSKIKIICPKHGPFLMKPNSHSNGQGCPECGRISARENITLEYKEFLKRAEKIHGNQYVYIESTYKNYTSKMGMHCSEHGLFEQTPHSHISMKTGCPKCGYLKAALSNQKGWEIVLDMFISVHGDRYNYDPNTYLNVTNKMRIECLNHGWFEQMPYQHYAGHGCKKCSSEENGDNKKITFSEFIEKALKKHGDKYSYGQAEYIDIFTSIHMTCLKHGEFLQAPRNHYRGSGCPKCNSSRGENAIRLILKELNIDFEEQKTFDDLIHRNKLKCDFFLPSLKTVIEYNGLQHYEPISVFGGLEGLKETQKRDVIKYDYLNSNEIRLIIIRYDIEDIENYLISELNIDNISS